MTPRTLDALILAKAERRPLAFATRLSDGTEFLLPDTNAAPLLNEAGLAAIETGKTGTRIVANEAWFIEARLPSPRLILVGAVHIAQALAPLAVAMGFDVTLVDPRQAFASAERFGGASMTGVKLISDWPDVALAALRPDARTAIVTLTHDAKLDDPALDHALRSDAFYIGALGSRKTHALRLERLAELGHQASTLSRIRGPVGLPLGAVTTPEIAVSIIAEIVAVHRGADMARSPKPESSPG